MPSVAELYNQEVLDGHREAVAALRDLLAHETDPAERRKLANALLRARPVKLSKKDNTGGKEQPPAERTAVTTAQPALAPEHAPAAAVAHLSSMIEMLSRGHDDELDDMIDDEIDQPLIESS
ncbi:MAG: hypothetical protein QM783_05135 [Phycisphaerales bacterium]